jgi:hypothetical protein
MRLHSFGAQFAATAVRMGGRCGGGRAVLVLQISGCLCGGYTPDRASGSCLPLCDRPRATA